MQQDQVVPRGNEVASSGSSDCAQDKASKAAGHRERSISPKESLGTYQDGLITGQDSEFENSLKRFVERLNNIN